MENSQIVQLFNRFKNDSGMHTEFYHGGCVQRTKAVCDYVINNKDYDSEKILFAKLTPDKSGLITCKALSFEKSKALRVNWTEHWIPIVLDDKGELLALDICLMDGPEKLSDYIRHFSNVMIEKSNICNARYSLDYNLLLRELRNGRTLEDVTLDDESVKIRPNMEKSHWLEEYKKEERSKNKPYLLEVKEKLVQKKLREAGIFENQGKTGDSITGHVSSKDKKVASVRQSVLKRFMLQQRQQKQ